MNLKQCSTKHWPLEWRPGIIKTNNSMGVMALELSPTTKECIEFAQNATNPIIDIGCSYGISTYHILENTTQAVIACDISQTSLDILKAGVPTSLHHRLELICDRFPEKLNFQPNSISAIHISQVIHFLGGEDIANGFRKCYDWLIPGGKLFICAITPDIGIFKNVRETYESQQQAGLEWPGLIKPTDFTQPEWKKQLPEFIHLFTAETLPKYVTNAGFIVEKTNYFTYEISLEVAHRTNGKEFISIIAKK